MQTKVRVAINGEELDEVDSRIIIHEYSESAPAMSLSAVDRGHGYGQTMTGVKRQSLDITIRFAIAEKRELAERTEVLDAVCAWMQ